MLGLTATGGTAKTSITIYSGLALSTSIPKRSASSAGIDFKRF